MIKLLQFLYFILLLKSFCAFSQDSTDIVNCLNKSDFESLSCKLSTETLFNRKIIYSQEYIKVDSVEYTSPYQLSLFKPNPSYEFLKTINKGQLHFSSSDDSKDFYKCYEVDSMLFFKIAVITIEMDMYNPDSLYQIIKKDLSNGIAWNKLKYHSSVCLDPEKLTRIRGSLGWVPFGNYDKNFENRIIKMEVGSTTLIKYDHYGMACVLFKTDEIQKFEVKKIRQISLPMQ